MISRPSNVSQQRSVTIEDQRVLVEVGGQQLSDGLRSAALRPDCPSDYAGEDG
jgi:hypothetical protein